MTKLKKISFCAIMVVCIICSMCPTFAHASDNVYHVEMSPPSYGDNHGYIELLYKHTTGGFYLARTLCWSAQHLLTTDSDLVADVSEEVAVSLTLDFSSGKVSLSFNSVNDTQQHAVTFMSLWSDGLYGVSVKTFADRYVYEDSFAGFEIVGYRVYGTYTSINDGQNGGLFNDFTIMYDDTAPIYNQLLEVVSLITQLAEYDETIIEKLDLILSDTSDINSQMADILGCLNDILTDLDFIIDNTDEIEYWLYECWVVLQDVRDYTWSVYLELHKANKKLDQIIELLNSSGESDLTSPDTSNLDNYYEMEQSLLDNSNVDVSSAVKVEIDQNALVVIWDMVQKCLDTHPQVFGLVITVLSLSIIALILGRGKS